MKIRSWSRCWYEEFWSLGRITPTTVNGVSPRNTCCPTADSSPNSSLASSSPRTATRRRSATSRSLMKRPPASAMMFRMKPYTGRMPVTAGAAALTPRRTRALRVMNSGLMPKASSTTTATVPHAMPRTVRDVRSFCARRSAKNSRHTSGDLARRPLDERVGRLQALQHLDIDGVGEASPDEALLGLAGARPDRHEGRVVAVDEEALRDVQDAIPAGDAHLRIGRVARAQGGPFHLGQDDLDREHRGLLLLVRLEPDLIEPALHARVGQCADLDRRRHTLLEPTNVDLVDGSPEDQVLHGGHAHEHGARLVRRQGHHGIADLDRVLEDVAIDGGADHGLHLLAAGQHFPAFLQRQPLLPQRELAARLVHPTLRDLDIGGRNQVLVAQLLLAGQLPLHVLELDLAHLHVAAELHHFQGRRVGRDLEQRLAQLYEVADLGEALPHHTGEDGFDGDLDPGLDGPDGEGLVDQRSAHHRHGLRPVLLSAAELARGGHGAQDRDHHSEGDDYATLHLGTAPRWCIRTGLVYYFFTGSGVDCFRHLTCCAGATGHLTVG